MPVASNPRQPQAVILAGGLGSRLGELTKATPKPMLPVNGRPFLDILIWNLRRQGVRRVVLSVGYLSDCFVDYYSIDRGLGVDITLVVEPAPAGTGGALLHAGEYLDQQFLLLNGDTLFDVDMHKLIKLQQDLKCKAVMALRHVLDTTRYGRVKFDENKRVTAFSEKNSPGPGWINGGTYWLHRDIINRIPATPCSLERDVFPGMITANQVAGLPSHGFFIDIGLPETYREASKLLADWRDSIAKDL